MLAAFNSSEAPITRDIEVDYGARKLSALSGDCPASPTAPGSVRLTIPAFGWAVCELGAQ